MSRPCLARDRGLCDGDFILDIQGRPGRRRPCFCTEIDALEDPYTSPVYSRLVWELGRTIAHTDELIVRERWHSQAIEERLRRADY